MNPPVYVVILFLLSFNLFHSGTCFSFATYCKYLLYYSKCEKKKKKGKYEVKLVQDIIAVI